VVDYCTPEGKRRRKYFPLKKDGEAYLGKVLATKKEGRYHDVFDVKKETLVSFDELADEYVRNYGGQRSFAGFKSHVIRDLRAEFGERRLCNNFGSASPLPVTLPHLLGPFIFRQGQG
jgi:hypothetical protein